jgi:hypothetical protein
VQDAPLLRIPPQQVPAQVSTWRPVHPTAAPPRVPAPTHHSCRGRHRHPRKEQGLRGPAKSAGSFAGHPGRSFGVGPMATGGGFRRHADGRQPAHAAQAHVVLAGQTPGGSASPATSRWQPVGLPRAVRQERPAGRPPPVERRGHRESVLRAAGQPCPHARHCAPDSAGLAGEVPPPIAGQSAPPAPRAGGEALLLR